jgi:uncharacterized protein
VAAAIRQAVSVLPVVSVNAVYHPTTFRRLPDVIAFIASLGVRQIYVNPDYSAPWTEADAEALPAIVDKIADFYIDSYLNDTPIFISIIDFKIAVILRGGYQALERCRMGRGEYAFSPEGNIYPCERLVGDGTNGEHRIGHIDSGLDVAGLVCHMAPGGDVNPQCRTCSLSDYCMNWCGCSNFMASGHYNRIGPFTCASEKANIAAAFRAFETLEEKKGPMFYDHLVCRE